ncbi:TnsA-like heteromeric transposase endonuclease subunit [Amycolatopsis lurida]|uniref:TnsA-like heteromeric transposase endonuclease subunit n=2 Tax=Amycolatopsis TaxID=1813 RepID=UPI00364B89DE
MGLRLDIAVAVELGRVFWSHVCRWPDLALAETGFAHSRSHLSLGSGWSRSWSASASFRGDQVVVPVRDLASLPLVGREPMRRFSWSRAQRHRPGLEFLVSTGRLHGFESLAESRLLLMLDFAGELNDVLSQPMKLQFQTSDGPREHIPDFYADTRSGRWLIDVRPAGRIAARDEVAFAATAEVALLLGWGYVVVTGWRQPAEATVDAFSAQRRPLADPLGIAAQLLDDVGEGSRPFGELAAATSAPVIGRAFLLHLLWHRRLGMDLSAPLTDRTLVTGAVR